MLERCRYALEQEKLRQKLTSKSDFLARRGAAWLLIERLGMEIAAISTSIKLFVASSLFWISFASKESATHSASCPSLHLTAPAESLTKAVRADARKEARLSGHRYRYRCERMQLYGILFDLLKCN